MVSASLGIGIGEEEEVGTERKHIRSTDTPVYSRRLPDSLSKMEIKESWRKRSGEPNGIRICQPVKVGDDYPINSEIKESWRKQSGEPNGIRICQPAKLKPNSGPLPLNLNPTPTSASPRQLLDAVGSAIFNTPHVAALMIELRIDSAFVREYS
ncbi:hypothetical protein ACLB2K_009840 [Fragaria x ananassa]